jgi:ABC-type transporter Mla maintaining outer membrane lipid asymmetry ATPase subunit MlaF
MSKFDDIQALLNKVSPVPVDLPRLYFLGDTGAGKTTIIRKVWGQTKANFPQRGRQELQSHPQSMLSTRVLSTMSPLFSNR